jgi:hypothetical protein
MAMLARRGLRPRPARLDLPFPADLPADAAIRLAAQLGHYAFRLFLRGAINHAEAFAPEETTAYLTGAQCRELAETLVDLRLATRAGALYRLVSPVTTFGDTLQWYVAHELRMRLGFDVTAAVKFHASGVGGDLDVVAAAEGKLVYLELKSSPPKHLDEEEIRAFYDRVTLVGPDLTLFVMDTALRLSDKVVPMLAAELGRRRAVVIPPRRVARELWAVTPRLYAVNSRPDLVANIARAIAEGLHSLAPPL